MLLKFEKFIFFLRHKFVYFDVKKLSIKYVYEVQFNEKSFQMDTFAMLNQTSIRIFSKPGLLEK